MVRDAYLRYPEMHSARAFKDRAALREFARHGAQGAWKQPVWGIYKRENILITIADIDRILKDRFVWGAPYRNMELETKRRSAIIYLHMRSKCGWIIDRLMPRLPRGRR